MGPVRTRNSTKITDIDNKFSHDSQWSTTISDSIETLEHANPANANVRN